MIIKCKMCGGDIEFTPGATYGTCEYCGSTSTIPKAEDENKLNRYNRANHFRRQCEFDKAVTAYEKILEQDDTDAEAHWGAVLSRYGIEYVEDPATKKRIPTCHRVQVASILADADYRAALENAPDEESRRLYREEAERIAAIQKEILAISSNEKPYDVFICYKETDENGQRTRDSQWAQDIYYGLTEQGYKVFFSRITLEDKLGQQYEPYIFAALNSAKVMVVIGSKPEYFNAVWVKNEWSRFLMLMAKDRKRLLIPCYRGMDPYDLPDELSGLQSQDMGKIGFMQDLLRGIKKVLTKDEKKPAAAQTIVQQTSAPTGGANTASLLERAYMFLEDGDWESANEYCEKVLDIDPRNARAYFGKLMAKMHARKENNITELRTSIRNDGNYQKAVRFANTEQKSAYEGCAQAIEDGIEYDRMEEIYQNAVCAKESASTAQAYAAAAELFDTIVGHKDSAAQAEQCREMGKEAVYNKACADMASTYVTGLEDAIRDFNRIIDWRDSREKIGECRKKIDELNKETEAKRRAEEEAKKKKARTTAIISVVIAVIIAAAILYVAVIRPSMEYSAANKLLAEGQYDAATEAFLELGEYKDAGTQALAAQYAKGESQLANGEYDAATETFNGIADYSDASTQAQEAQYQKAGVLNKEGKYDEAYVEYASLIGYKDVDSIIKNDENIAVVARAAYIAQFDVGKTVTLGNYGGEPIEWLVLDAEGESRKMIAVKGQDAVPFNTSYKNGNMWVSSYICTWLNDTFYNAAFSAEEKAMIVPGVTNDNVWLLSTYEAKKYFENDKARVCYATFYAESNGAYTGSSGAGRWWLRSPGSYPDDAVCVNSDGDVYSSGLIVSADYVMARPVVVVRLGF